MTPTVGRIVHYTNLGDQDGRYPPEQQAAIITKVVLREDADVLKGDGHPEENLWTVSLHIFYATGDFYMQGVLFSAEYERGHWTWPPRV